MISTLKPLGLALAVLTVLFSSACTKQPDAPGQNAAAGLTSAKAAEGGRVIAEGRLVAYPGAEVMISSELAGVILRLPVDEKSTVGKGDVIAELKADELRALLAEAKAKTAEAQADLNLAQVEVARAEKLWDQQMGSRQMLERAQRDRDVARARFNTGQASVRRIEATLAKSLILSPIDGTVIARNANPGETVEAGTRLVAIADLGRTRIEAEVDEYDAGRIKAGMPATVTAEGFGNIAWKGRVEEIPDQVVGRRLRPQDPGKPSDTRVLLIKIALLEPTPLKLGQRVEVAIRTDAESK
ncbi:MAG: efflux RND transporter periplasmic adaptor subunit [Pseudomonadota bacterium]|jgi:RND family efflux transporter MFP subunit